MSEITLGKHSLPEPINRAGHERPVIVVVGMHRSGTSLCSNVLGLMGVDMAEEAGPNIGNELGHFERWDIVGLQDEALALFDRAYHSPTHDFPLPPAWWADFRVRSIRERLKACLETILARGGLVGFKDPRTTRLMPMWNRIFAELRVRPRFVVCLRNPAHVALSLQTRDGLAPQTGELRALDYIVDALRHTRGRDRCFIQYDEWMSDSLSTARKLLDFVAPELHFEAREFEIAIQSIVRPEANHAGASSLKPRQPLVRSFYDLVEQFVASGGRDPSLDASIESFTHSYIAFRQLLGPFEAQFKNVAAARAELERTLVDTRTSLDAESRRAAESDQRVAELTAALEAAQAACAQHAALHAATAEALAETTQALEAERAATAHLTQTLSAAQAGAQQALAESEARSAQLAAELQQAQAECAHVVEQYVSVSNLLAETVQALDTERACAVRLGETQAGLQQAAADTARRAAELEAALQEAQADHARLADENATVVGQLAQTVQTLGLEPLPTDPPEDPIPAAQANAAPAE